MGKEIAGITRDQTISTSLGFSRKHPDGSRSGPNQPKEAPQIAIMLPGILIRVGSKSWDKHKYSKRIHDIKKRPKC